MRSACLIPHGAFFLAFGLLIGTLGCGSSDAPENATNLSAETPGELPTTAIANGSQSGNAPAPEKDTPQWYLHEITVLRNILLPDELPLDKIRKFQRDRNYKIVEHAKQAIAKTHEDPAKQKLFEAAVHHAMEAQLQLAIQVNGVPEDEHRQNVEELYQNAELLHERDPASAAASEAGFTLVKFAEIMAGKLAGDDPRWLEEYARQARLFAKNFPADDARAIAKLDGAGWSCEAHGRTELALACYAELQEQFAKNPQAQHVPAIIRRLQLPGKELKLAGPTHDGGFLSIDAFRDKVVLVAFWAADTKDFELDAAILKDIYGKYAAAGVEIVGVNLDEDEAGMQAFMKQHGFTWPNIFYIDQNKRRWNNPLVRYYGVREIPTYWLVNQKGEVVDTRVSLPTAEEQIQELLGTK